MTSIWILLGFIGAIAFLALIRVKPKHESLALAVGLVVAALIYASFAASGDASQSWVAIEIAGIGIYGGLAALGLRYSNWWLMLGWMVHPLWDVGLHLVNEGAAFTSAWYATTCASFDLLVAAYTAGLQLGIFNLSQHYES